MRWPGSSPVLLCGQILLVSLLPPPPPLSTNQFLLPTSFFLGSTPHSPVHLTRGIASLSVLSAALPPYPPGVGKPPRQPLRSPTSFPSAPLFPSPGWPTYRTPFLFPTAHLQLVASCCGSDLYHLLPLIPPCLLPFPSLWSPSWNRPL